MAEKRIYTVEEFERRYFPKSYREKRARRFDDGERIAREALRRLRKALGGAA